MPNLCPRPQLALAYRRGASSVGQREHFRATVHCYPTGRTSEAEANHSRSQRRVADISTLLLLERCSLPSSSLWYKKLFLTKETRTSRDEYLSELLKRQEKRGS